MSFIDSLAYKLRPYVPFSGLNAWWRVLDKGAKSILDVGCGTGVPMRFFNRQKRFYAVGIDVFEPYIKEAKSNQTHDEYVLCDARGLPFKEKSFDVVLCTEVIEHMEKEQAWRLIQAMEEIARREVIISTPVGVYKQGICDGNPHWEHKSTWEPHELKEKGYQVKGVGLRNLGGEEGLATRIPKPLRFLQYAVYVLVSPVAYFFPKFAGDMVCYKRLGITVKTRYNEMAGEGKYAYPGPAAHASNEIFHFLRPSGLILDLGCGSGRHTAYLIQNELQVIALDISPVQLKRVIQGDRVCGDAVRLPFKSDTFDSLLCSELLEHLEKPELCVNEVHRVLKDGGVACFTTPCLNIPMPILVTLYRRLAGIKLEEGEHMHVFSASDLRNMLMPLFSVVDVRYTKFTALLQYWLRRGYGLDRILSRMTKLFPPLRYLAGAVFIKVMKRNSNLPLRSNTG